MHASHASVVALHWFDPHTSRMSFVHAGQQMPVVPTMSARHVKPARQVLRPPGVGQEPKHAVIGVVGVPRLTHVPVGPHAAALMQLSTTQ
jgi:hypothetical protein